MFLAKDKNIELYIYIYIYIYIYNVSNYTIYIYPKVRHDNLKLINSMIMEYQKIINLLDNTPNQPTKFRK